LRRSTSTRPRSSPPQSEAPAIDLNEVVERLAGALVLRAATGRRVRGDGCDHGCVRLGSGSLERREPHDSRPSDGLPESARRLSPWTRAGRFGTSRSSADRGTRGFASPPATIRQPVVQVTPRRAVAPMSMANMIRFAGIFAKRMPTPTVVAWLEALEIKPLNCGRARTSACWWSRPRSGPSRGSAAVRLCPAPTRFPFSCHYLRVGRRPEAALRVSRKSPSWLAGDRQGRQPIPRPAGGSREVGDAPGRCRLQIRSRCWPPTARTSLAR
jgi:hypothetical protein